MKASSSLRSCSARSLWAKSMSVLPVRGNAQGVESQARDGAEHRVEVGVLLPDEGGVGRAADHRGDRERGDLRVELGVGEALLLQPADGAGVAGYERLRALAAQAQEVLVDGRHVVEQRHQPGVAAIRLEVEAVGLLDRG